jgi:pantoate kinase
MPKPKKATVEQKKKIQEGVNRMGKKAVKEMKEGMPPEAVKLAERLNKLDAFINEMVNESKGQMQPKEIVEMLMVKARHTGFAYSAEATPEPVLGWMTGLLYYNAFDVFAVTKSHVLADKEA